MEQWAKDWLKAERAIGKKCLEIKTKGSGHYVYYPKYLGTLKEAVGLVRPNSTPKLQASTIRSVTEYGNSMLLRESIKDLRPVLEEAFPDNWREIYALSMLRVIGNVPLKRANDSWEKL